MVMRLCDNLQAKIFLSDPWQVLVYEDKRKIYSYMCHELQCLHGPLCVMPNLVC